MIRLRFGLAALAIIISSLTLSAQSVRKQRGCGDTTIAYQADSIRQLMAKDGFIVVKEAFLSMETQFEIPVMVALTQDNTYQFVFIGDTSSNSYEVKMFDWDENQVAYQHQQNTAPLNNVISYAYVPRFSEYHLIKPLQVNNKKRMMCGYVMLLKKVKV